VRPAGARNEAWDDRVYNIAAKEILNPNTPKLSERLQFRAEEAARARENEAAPIESGDNEGDAEDDLPSPATPQRPRPAFRKPGRRGGFVKNW
jgi:hypothetical protein